MDIPVKFASAFSITLDYYYEHTSRNQSDNGIINNNINNDYDHSLSHLQTWNRIELIPSS
jgi:hypothetical protein